MATIDTLAPATAFGAPSASAPLHATSTGHAFEFFTIAKGDTGKASCDVERAIIDHWSGCDVVSTDYNVHVLLVDNFPLAAVWFTFEDGTNAVTRDVRMHKIYTHAPFRERGLAAYVFYDFCRRAHSMRYNRVIADPGSDGAHLPFLVMGLRFEEPEHIDCGCNEDDEDTDYDADEEEEEAESCSDMSEDEADQGTRKRKAGSSPSTAKRARVCYARDVQLRLSVDVIESKLLRAFAREFGQTPIPPSCFDNVKQQQREQQREEPVVALPTAERKEGDAIREAVRKILDGMPRLPRSPEQAGVHEAVIAEWTDAARDPETNVGSLLMRRSVALPPKYRTCAVAIFAAAFMWTQPNADIRVNSTSERVAAVILRMVRSMLRPLAGSGNDGFFVSQSRDRLVIRTPDGGTAILDSRVVAPAPRPNAPLPRPQAQLRPQMPLVWQGAAVAPPPMVMALMFGPPPPGTR